MALPLARSPHTAAALPAPRVSHFAPPLPPRRHHRAGLLRLRLPAAAVAASSPPEAQAAAPAEEEQQQGEKRRKLYVANLPWSVPAQEVQKLFAECGTVKDVQVNSNAMPRALDFSVATTDDSFFLITAAYVCSVKLIKGKDGRNRGFAFVTMSTAVEAAAAVEKLDSHVSVLAVVP
jgi:RNA recognition motif-containing protein